MYPYPCSKAFKANHLSNISISRQERTLVPKNVSCDDNHIIQCTKHALAYHYNTSLNLFVPNRIKFVSYPLSCSIQLIQSPGNEINQTFISSRKKDDSLSVSTRKEDT